METEVVLYRIDGKDYVLEQNIMKIDRTVGLLRQYFPDVVILYGDEHGKTPDSENTGADR